jgi:hypothetical protein
VHFSLPFVPCSSTFFLVNFFLHSIAINFSSHHTHATYAMYTELGILQYIVHMVGRISKNFNPGWNLLFVCIRPATSSFLRKDSSFYFLASQTSLWSVTTVPCVLQVKKHYDSATYMEYCLATIVGIYIRSTFVSMISSSTTSQLYGYNTWHWHDCLLQVEYFRFLI